MPLAANKTDSTIMAADHAAHHNALAVGFNTLPFNVKDVAYGAVGDGTTDDTAAFTSALAAAAGGSCFVPPGTYKLTGNVTVAAGTRLIGSGGSSIIKTDSEIRCKSNTEVSYLHLVTITSLARDGNGIPTVAARAHVQFYDDPTRLTNCRAHHLTGDGLGISFFKVDDFECHSCDFQAGYYDGVHMWDSTNGRIHHNRVRNSYADGMSVYGGSGHIFESNRSTHNRKGGYFSYGAVAGGVGTGATKLTFVNNEASNSVAYDGFDINGTGNDVWTYHIFKGNRSHSNYGWGYNLTGSGNSYEALAAYDNGLSGILLNYDTNVAARAAHEGISLAGTISRNNNTRNQTLQYNLLVDQIKHSVVDGVRAAQPSTGYALEKTIKVVEATECSFDHLHGPSHVAAQTALEMVDITDATGMWNRRSYIKGTSTGMAARSVASAATLTLPNYISSGELVVVTGTTTIGGMTAEEPGFRVTLKFAGILTFTDGGNLLLAGNFVTTADDTITIISDGTNWFEIARSVN